MLSRIENIIRTSKSNFDVNSGVCFCSDYKVSDKECLVYLDEQGCFEQPIFVDDLSDNSNINLELSLHSLTKIGFYYSFESFIVNNRYAFPDSDFYIYDIDSSQSKKNENLAKHEAIINLINSVKNIAKYSYFDAGVDNAIIFREDKSLFLSFEFDINTILAIKESEVETINKVSSIFLDSVSEKKLLFINELINLLTNEKNESQRFIFLLSSISDFYEKSTNAYQYYLRDFSYNKLKIELDSKALEFAQKIQSVINESQTKLIAIPTVFVLAFVSSDYSDLLSNKNIFTIISLFIFAILIQLFLNNQFSTLRFINENVISYKDTFKRNDIDKISSKFSLVDKEREKQEKRLILIEAILWLIPVGLLCTWLFGIGYNLLAYMSIAIVLIIFLIKLFVLK